MLIKYTTLSGDNTYCLLSEISGIGEHLFENYYYGSLILKNGLIIYTLNTIQELNKIFEEHFVLANNKHKLKKLSWEDIKKDQNLLNHYL
jgi:hypothetical protein